MSTLALYLRSRLRPYLPYLGHGRKQVKSHFYFIQPEDFSISL
jgi:hypothetical protein